MKKLLLSMLIFSFSITCYAVAIIDRDVLSSIHSPQIKSSKHNDSIAIIIFLKSRSEITSFLHEIKTLHVIKVQALNCLPAVVAIIPKEESLVNKLAQLHATAQISLHQAGSEELEVSAQAILLSPSETYPTINNWWKHGYTGLTGVLGLIDSGVAVEHPGLMGKTIIVDQEADSDYFKYQHGVRTPHGTGAACIYAGVGSGNYINDIGMAFGTKTIISGLAGEGDGQPEDLLLTASTLNWMLTRATLKPTVINYSFGNGSVRCSQCTDWSGLAKMVDYVINHDKILWVKSAGNQGYSGMTTPADNYNGLTVANMNPTIIQDGVAYQTANRTLHSIRYNSSRGPTLIGRRKPDISAPGNDTRTCAPDDTQYPFQYKSSMNFENGYRLMGGTSSAAPHVGGAVLLLQDAGIHNPMAAKALLINSADAWTDSGVPGPDDPDHPYNGGHFAVQGSEWNPSYGWGYMNMQQAFEQRLHIIEGSLSKHMLIKEYPVDLPVGGKVTLVHERRVGFNENGSEWQLSPISLELINAKTQQLIASDDSLIDTVHQVANCIRAVGEKQCSSNTKPLHAIIRVRLQNANIEGSDNEPFALVFG